MIDNIFGKSTPKNDREGKWCVKWDIKTEIGALLIIT